MADEDVSGDDKQHYSRVASVLKDRLQNGGALKRRDGDSALMEVLIIAAKEFGIESGDDQGWIKQEVKRCQHSCSDHAETMNPKLWESLPQELLKPVFGHLPLDAICRVQFLNKEWQQTITADPDFHRLCNEVYPNMVCLISSYFCSTFWVRVFNINNAKWHSYKLDAGHPPVDWAEDFAQMDFECEDGGLVCFVTHLNMDMKRKRDRSTFFHVVNPLTRMSQELPPLFDMRRMQLVQISVDERTGAFQVFIVARRCVWTNASRGWIMSELATLLYDSLTREWRPLPCDTRVVSLNKHFVYDFANGQLTATIDHHNLSSSFDKTARYKESVFVLKTGTEGPPNEELAIKSPTFYIDEFLWKSSNWVKTKSHRCNLFEHPPKTQFEFKLYACKGFLLVLAELDSDNWCKKKLAWLYDL